VSLADSRCLRVLILDEEVPCPANSGKRIRTWNLLRRLADRHDLHLFTHAPVTSEAQKELGKHRVRVTAVDPLPESHGPQFWGRLFGNLFSEYPYSVSKHFTQRLEAEVVKACDNERFDLAHIEWVPYARYMTPNVPRLITAHNIESDIWNRRARHSDTYIGRRFFGLQAERMEAFERRAGIQSECVVTVSELDAQRFRYYGAKNVRVVPNGVDLDYFRAVPSVLKTNSLVFVGSLDWFPNEDAVKDFALHVLPLVRSRDKSIILRVVGRSPSDRLAATLRDLPGVELIGEVPDVRPYLAEARVVVVPLRIGGGTRIKILEALAMGKPVVSTSIGAEGLELENGRDILIADTPEEFAGTIEALFARPEEQSRLGRNGRDVVEKLYGWDAAADALENAWMAVAGRTETIVSGADLAVGESRR